MKKIIIILLLILPVAVALVAYLLAGFIGRNIVTVTVERITFNYYDPAGIYTFYSLGEDDENRYGRAFAVGEEINIRNRITIYPTRASWNQIHFETAVVLGTATGDEIYFNEQTGILRAVAPTFARIELIMLNAELETLLTIVIQGIEP